MLQTVPEVPDWIHALSDDRLARLEAVVATERKRRDQEALNRLAAEATDDIAMEFAAVHAKYLEQKATEAQELADARQRRMLDARDSLRAGNVAPHFKECAVCFRAVATLRHDLACPDGKAYVKFIVR
jgi:hypothetical protein